THHKPPPRVPLASFGFQKPLANSGGNPSRVAERRSAFWRKRRFYFLAARLGFEPRYTVPETVVLPLDDLAIVVLTIVQNRLFIKLIIDVFDIAHKESH
ncbi:MAG: hypothetical protein UT78_C0010G0001, partial [Candidatus Nomurabacteria bacterium GW2011_GWF2_40_12]